MTVDELNALPHDAAREAFTACCGAPAWVARMIGARPFTDRAALLRTADATWGALSPAERQEAIAHHPRLGESLAAAPSGARAREWSAEEQSGARWADARTREALAEGNAEYEGRFGHAFIVCATGLSADAMLGALRSRLRNDPHTELTATTEELRKITRLRLEKFVGGT